MEIELQEFQEIADFIKEHDGEFTKEELWKEYKKRKQESPK